LFYVDASSWGNDLPWGAGAEVWWDRVYPADSSTGISDTTPESLTQRWIEATGQPLDPAIGHAYLPMQFMLYAIERAGILDGSAIKNAIAETDMLSINSRVKFIEEEHYSGLPLFVGQWVKTEKPQMGDLQITFCPHDWLHTTHEPIFPIP
jgi:ABC-type branched-subunit amino acid transport system substrate-binding protein